MGNNPSTPKAATGTPTSSGAHDSPKPQQQPHHHQKKDSKSPLPVHNHRAAAPPEPSLAQARGSTVIKGSQARPISQLAASPPGSTKSFDSPSAAAPARPTATSKSKPEPPKDEPSKPVDVPNPSNAPPPSQASADRSSTFDPTESSMERISSNTNVSSFITRPPRMPLPIEEEIHTPGSPIIAPADIGEPIDAVDALDPEPIDRKSSNLSTTTIDEDDAEELRVDKTRPTVPTRLEWLRGGEKVYVTGTIFHWNRKQRLHPVEGRPGVFATTISILPGTHHIRFLVDNNMQTSPDLPTTVDFGNNLVNYIEVSPDDVPAEPQTIPGAHAAQNDQKGRAKQSAQAEPEEDRGKQQRDREVLPVEAFARTYPQYLLDYDQAEDTSEYQAAIAAIEKLPTPPSLPGFLAKPILNAAVLMKDDNSVLNMPNHTTLNHLATSSIKNNTLAVSATTRYRDKYVTTIVYKPVSAGE